MLLGLPLKKQTREGAGAVGWAGEEGLERVGKSGRGVQRWQEEDPGVLNHPPSPFFACFCHSPILSLLPDR